MKKHITESNIAFALANLKQLVFEVTDSCNLNCAYCTYGELYNDFDERKNNMLPVDKAIRLINYLVEYWNSEINVSAKQHMFISFYGGEPLMNVPFIKQIVSHIETKVNCTTRKFSYSMTTNGLLLHKYMDYLKEKDFNLLISLDGNEENTAYRVDKAGNSSFKRIIRNIDALNKKYPDYFQKRVNFNAVLHNKNSVEEIHSFFKNKYNKIPSIGELNNMGIRSDMQEKFMHTYRNFDESLNQSEHYEEIEQEMFVQTGNYKSATIFLHRYSGLVFRDYTDLLFPKTNQNIIPTGTCLPFSKKMFVTVNGKILPCERIGHQFTMGKITDSEIELDPQAIAYRYNLYYDKMDNQCSNCKNAGACTQCIFNLNDIDDKPTCHGYMNDEIFENYTNRQLDFFRKNPEAYKTIMEDVFVI